MKTAGAGAAAVARCIRDHAGDRLLRRASPYADLRIQARSGASRSPRRSAVRKISHVHQARGRHRHSRSCATSPTSFRPGHARARRRRAPVHHHPARRRTLDLVVARHRPPPGMRFTRQGQSCSAGTSLLHPRRRLRRRDRATAIARDAAHSDCRLPDRRRRRSALIISREQLTRHRATSSSRGQTPGAKILVRRLAPADPALQRRLLHQPTLIEGVRMIRPVCRRRSSARSRLRLDGTTTRTMLRACKRHAIWPRRRDLDPRPRARMDSVSVGRGRVCPGVTSSSPRARRLSTAGSR